MLMPLKYWLFVHLTGLSLAYKSGAPTSMCATMMPHHKGAKVQTIKSPYSLTISSRNTQDGKISLKINGDPFVGVLLQARKNPDQPVALGSFLNLPNSLKTMACDNFPNSAVTHKDNHKKEDLEVEWLAPPNMEGDVTFVATIVKNFSTFWTGIISEPIHVELYTGQVDNSADGVKQHLYEDCNVKKDCIGFPDGCLDQKTCRTITTISLQNDELEFEMMSLESKYVATGISLDQKMGGDYVVECVLEDVFVKAYESWNVPNRKENVRTTVRDKLQLENGDYTDGNIYCKVKIAVNDIQIESFIVDFKRNSYYGLLAAGKKVNVEEGSTKTTGVGFHDVSYSASDNFIMLYKMPRKNKDSFYEGCNLEMNCFGVPDNCVQSENCKYVVSILAQGTNYHFRLKGETTGYIAVGLSHDKKMGEDSVMECVNNGRTISAHMSWNKPGMKANTREGISQVGINFIRGNITNGVMFCEFTRQSVTVIEQKTFDLINDKYVLLLAAGSSSNDNGVGFHDQIFSTSSEQRSLSDVRALRSADRLLIKLHGAFMICAWIGSASIGIVLARYFKQTWVGSSLCAKDLWFAWHRFFMLITWCLTITGCVLIFVDVGNWVSGGSQKHAITGIITVILCFIQPIGAAFRPHPSAKKRPIFNWLHWLIGNSAHILSIVTIFFAVPLNKAQIPAWVDWILVAFVAFYVILHIILSFTGCLSERRAQKRINSFPMNEMNTSRSSTSERKQDAPMAGVRKFLLFIHIVVITGLTAAIIVVIVLAPIETQWETIQNKFMGM